MAIHSMGFEARSFTGSQAGMITDATHGAARIVDVTPVRLREALDEGAIVIVAGFQGFNRDTRDITTLGRGGSDTTAVALAAALEADVCEIYSDVDGIFTADPRVVPKAQKLTHVSSEEMLELAANGAKVLYIRAVEYARRHGVLIHARSTFSSGEGTWVLGQGMTLPKGVTLPDGREGEEMEEPIVAGVATDLSQAKITVTGVPDVPGKAAEIFKIVAKSGANVDMIVQNVSADGATTDLTFTVPAADYDRARDTIAKAKAGIGYARLDGATDVAKVSVIGIGMRSHAGVAAKAFRALADRGINIRAITTSEIKFSVLIDAAFTELAVRTLHTLYGLDKA
jgi:aspartate kinase